MSSSSTHDSPSSDMLLKRKCRWGCRGFYREILEVLTILCLLYSKYARGVQFYPGYFGNIHLYSRIFRSIYLNCQFCMKTQDYSTLFRVKRASGLYLLNLDCCRRAGCSCEYEPTSARSKMKEGGDIPVWRLLPLWAVCVWIVFGLLIFVHTLFLFTDEESSEPYEEGGEEESSEQ